MEQLHPFDIDELLTTMLSHICDGATYKSARLVCHRWHTLAGDRIDQFSNHLWTLINKFPDENWDWIEIAANPNTQPNFILNYQQNPLIKQSIEKFINARGSILFTASYDDEQLSPYAEGSDLHEMIENSIYSGLARNSNINIEFIKQHKHSQWDWGQLVHNPNFQWEWLKVCDNNNYWPFGLICQHPNFTWDIIQTVPDIWDLISSNPNITIAILQQYWNDPKYTWNWFDLSQNPGLKLEDIFANQHLPWDWLGVSQHPNLTWAHICQHPNEDWVVECFASNGNIAEACLQFQPGYQLDYYALSQYEGFTWDFIAQRLDQDWNWSRLSSHPNVTFKHIKDTLSQGGWLWGFIELNPNLTWRDVVDNQQFTWDFRQLARNTFSQRTRCLKLY